MPVVHRTNKMSHDHPENPSAPSVGAVPESPPAVSVGSGDWFGDDINLTDEDCPKCGNALATRRCGTCGGDGFIDLYEEDPIWYDDGDLGECEDCRGHGDHCWCQKCGWDVNENRFLNGKPACELPSPNAAVRHAEDGAKHAPRSSPALSLPTG